MVNLLGDLWLTAGSDEVVQPSWAILADPHARLHLYGKAPRGRGARWATSRCSAAIVDEVAAGRCACATVSVRNRRSPGEAVGDDGPMQRPRSGSTSRMQEWCCAVTSPATSTPCRR